MSCVLSVPTASCSTLSTICATSQNVLTTVTAGCQRQLSKPALELQVPHYTAPPQRLTINCGPLQLTQHHLNVSQPTVVHYSLHSTTSTSHNQLWSITVYTTPPQRLTTNCGPLQFTQHHLNVSQPTVVHNSLPSTTSTSHNQLWSITVYTTPPQRLTTNCGP